MKEHMWMRTVCWVVGLLLMGSAAKGAPPPVLTNLFMTELVALLNENTPLQINLEMDTRSPKERVDLDRSRLKGFSPADLLEVVRPLTNYSVITNETTYIIAPTRKLADPHYPMNYRIAAFGVTNEQPFVAAQLLARQLPFHFESAIPFLFTRTEGPRFPEEGDLPHWPTNSIDPVTRTMREATLRSWLCALFNAQQKAYWITWLFSPPGEIVDNNRSGVEVSVHRPEELQSGGIYARRDPEEMARREKEWQEHWRKSNRQVVVNRTNVASQAYAFRLFVTEGDNALACRLRIQSKGTNAVRLSGLTGTLIASNAAGLMLKCPIASEHRNGFSPELNAATPTVEFAFSCNTQIGTNATVIIAIPAYSTNEARTITTHYSFSITDFFRKGIQ